MVSYASTGWDGCLDKGAEHPPKPERARSMIQEMDGVTEVRWGGVMDPLSLGVSTCSAGKRFSVLLNRRWIELTIRRSPAKSPFEKITIGSQRGHAVVDWRPVYAYG